MKEKLKLELIQADKKRLEIWNSYKKKMIDSANNKVG